MACDSLVVGDKRQALRHSLRHEQPIERSPWTWASSSTAMTCFR